MPIYEYACSNCGHQLEAFQKLSDPPLEDCPECEQGALKKLVSAASFRLKGTGWYETDFKNKGKPASKEKEKKEEPKKEAPAPKDKTDTKSGGDTAAA